MARYRVSVKGSMNCAGQHIEPGMYVEIASLFPVSGMGSLIAQQVNNAFMAKYGVDLKKMNCLNAGFLKVDKI